jgi:hypothetical protein
VNSAAGYGGGSRIAGRGSRAGVPLAPMWLALGGTLALAVVIAALVTFLGLRALHFREFQPEPRLSAATLYDLLKVAFAVAAGVGGVVALVTAYRRQRVAEFAQDLATRTEAREATRLFNERFAAAAGQLGTAARRCSWPGCMQWPASRMTGSSGARPAWTCCAPVFACLGGKRPYPPRRQTVHPGRVPGPHLASRYPVNLGLACRDLRSGGSRRRGRYVAPSSE